jgi:hypothetical protein
MLEYHAVEGLTDEYAASQTLRVIDNVAETRRRVGRDLERGLRMYVALQARDVSDATAEGEED